MIINWASLPKTEANGAEYAKVSYLLGYEPKIGGEWSPVYRTVWVRESGLITDSETSSLLDQLEAQNV